MKRLFMALVLIVFTAEGWAQSTLTRPHSPSDHDVKEWSSKGGKWVPDPDAPGTYSIMATGNPAEGDSVRYVKFDPGASIGWHWHPAAEMVFGESGQLEYRILNSTRKITITSGSWASFPAHSIHKGTCVSKIPCTFYLQNLVATEKHMVDNGGKEIKAKDISSPRRK